MRPRRQREAAESASHDRWLISYADFMTLLFAFFVVLFAATYRDNQTIRKLARAIHNGFQTMGAFANESGNGGAYPTETPNADDSEGLDPEPVFDRLEGKLNRIAEETGR